MCRVHGAKRNAPPLRAWFIPLCFMHPTRFLLFIDLLIGVVQGRSCMMDAISKSIVWIAMSALEQIEAAILTLLR
jgi:hypothetical protein